LLPLIFPLHGSHSLLSFHIILSFFFSLSLYLFISLSHYLIISFSLIFRKTMLYVMSALSALLNFTATDSSQNWTVPTGIEKVTIQAFGAQGNLDLYGEASAGLGGSVTTIIAVTPSETLAVFVRTQGGNTSFPGYGGNGDFNGGGMGGEVLLTLVMNIWPPVEEVLVICIRGTKRSQNRVVVAGGGGSCDFTYGHLSGDGGNLVEGDRGTAESGTGAGGQDGNQTQGGGGGLSFL
jgi:hypothetical protein